MDASQITHHITTISNMWSAAAISMLQNEKMSGSDSAGHTVTQSYDMHCVRSELARWLDASLIHNLTC